MADDKKTEIKFKLTSDDKKLIKSLENVVNKYKDISKELVKQGKDVSNITSEFNKLVSSSDLFTNSMEVSKKITKDSIKDIREYIQSIKSIVSSLNRANREFVEKVRVKNTPYGKEIENLKVLEKLRKQKNIEEERARKIEERASEKARLAEERARKIEERASEKARLAEERARKIEERASEKERLAKERASEKARLAEERASEKERLAKERASEKARLAEERARKIENNRLYDIDYSSAKSNFRVNKSSFGSIDKSINRLKEYSKSLKDAKVNVSQFEVAINKLSESYSSELNSKIDSYSRNLNKLKTTAKENAWSLQKFELAKKRLDNAFSVSKSNLINSYDSQIKKLKLSMDDAEKKASNFAKTMLTFGNRIKTYFSYKIIGSLTNAIENTISDAIELEAEFAKMQAISGATDSQLTELKNTIYEVGESSIFTLKELAESTTTLAQAGMSVEQINDILATTNELAMATGSTLESSADIMTSAIAVWGLNVEEANKLADVFVNVMNNSKATMGTFTQAIQYAGAMASNAGVSVEELSAAAGTLAQAGHRDSIIGTELRNVIAQIIAPTATLRNKFEAIGLTQDDLDIKTKGLINVLQTLKNSGIDSSIALELMGKRGGPALIAMLEHLDELMELVDQTQKLGSAAEAAEKRSKTLSGTWNKFMNKVRSTSEEGLTFLVGCLETIYDWLFKIGEVIGYVIGSIPQFIKDVKLAAADINDIMFNNGKKVKAREQKKRDELSNKASSAAIKILDTDYTKMPEKNYTVAKNTTNANIGNDGEPLYDFGSKYYTKQDISQEEWDKRNKAAKDALDSSKIKAQKEREKQLEKLEKLLLEIDKADEKERIRLQLEADRLQKKLEKEKDKNKRAFNKLLEEIDKNEVKMKESERKQAEKDMNKFLKNLERNAKQQERLRKIQEKLAEKARKNEISTFKLRSSGLEYNSELSNAKNAGILHRLSDKDPSGALSSAYSKTSSDLKDLYSLRDVMSKKSLFDEMYSKYGSIYDKVSSGSSVGILDSATGKAINQMQELKVSIAEAEGRFGDLNNVDISDLNNQIDSLEKKLERIAKSGDSPLGQLKEGFKTTIESMKDEITYASLGSTIANDLNSGIADALYNFNSGAKSFKEAFSDMARSIIEDISKMLIKMAIYQAMAAAINWVGSGASSTATVQTSSGATTVPIPTAKPSLTAASGGSVTGGIANRDSVPAMLMPGEYVLKKSAVDALGTNFLNDLNNNAAQTLAGTASALSVNDNQESSSEPSVVNVWVVSKEEETQMGPNDVIATISKDILTGGQTKRLIQSVVAGRK